MFEWLAANWPGLAAAFTAGLVLMAAIAKLTPTTKDDEFVARLQAIEKQVIDFLPTDASKAPTEVIVKN